MELQGTEVAFLLKIFILLIIAILEVVEAGDSFQEEEVVLQSQTAIRLIFANLEVEEIALAFFRLTEGISQYLIALPLMFAQLVMVGIHKDQVGMEDQ